LLNEHKNANLVLLLIMPNVKDCLLLYWLGKSEIQILLLNGSYYNSGTSGELKFGKEVPKTFSYI